MPFLGSLFNCSSSDTQNEIDSKFNLIKDIEEGKAERLFMKTQLEELAKRLDEISKKAIAIFGVEKDIAVMNSNINYIKRDMEELKEELKDIKRLINKSR